jgi:hypothetical protein
MHAAHVSHHILCSTLFSTHPSICSSLNVKSQVSSKVIVLYVLIFTVLGIDGKAEDSGVNGSKHFPFGSAVRFFVSAVLIS